MSKLNVKDRVKRIASPAESFTNPTNDIINDIAINDDVNVKVSGDVKINLDIKRKPKFEDLFDRHTVFFEKEISEKINLIAGQGKGVKTQIVNDALREYFKKRKV